MLMLNEIYYRLLFELSPEDIKSATTKPANALDDNGLLTQSPSHYGKLTQAIYEDDPTSNIGMFLGKSLRPHALCDFSRALTTAGTFMGALGVIDKLHFIQSTAYYLDISESDEGLTVSLCYPYKRKITETQRRFSAETVFSFITNLVRDSIDKQINPSQIYCDYKRPTYSEDYDASFRCNAEFSQPLSRIVFPASLRDAPLLTADPMLHKIYKQKCLESAQASKRQCRFDYRATTYLLLNKDKLLSADELAQAFNISTRGLQKKLSAIGSSYSSLLTNVRIELAKLYFVQRGLNAQTTSELLGFQTTSGFRRFFRSEFGISVNEFLDQIERANPNSARDTDPIEAMAS